MSNSATPAFPPANAGPDYDDAVYVISVAADLADMHPQTLRAYERKGLISPQRTSGNTRRYSRRDVDKLQFIQHLTQDKGLNLAGVELVLQLGEELETKSARVAELEDLATRMAERLRADVEAAHASHRYEIVKAPRRDMTPHSSSRAVRSSVKRAKPVAPPDGRDLEPVRIPE